MLLRARQSELALRSAATSAAIVDLLEAIAAAPEGTGYCEIKRGWALGRGLPKEPVIEALGLPAAARRELSEAVAADLEFEDNLDDEHFRFRFRQLDEGVRGVGVRLLGSLYDAFVRSGLLLGSGEVLSRTTWEDAFREANPGIDICPACLTNQLEGRIDGAAAVDADHYLPKSVYPHLGIHRLNLAPICMPCNRVAKKATDPLVKDGVLHGLPSVWFPYERAGIDDLNVDFDLRKGKRFVGLGARAGREIQAELYDHLFSLSSRWTGALKSVHEDLVEELAVREVAADAAAIRAYLVGVKELKEAASARTVDAYLAGRYCEWLGRDDDGIASLVEELRQRYN